MRLRNLFIIFWPFLFACLLQGLDSASLKGKIIDKETKDPLPAYVTVEGMELGSTAGYDGHFELNLKSFQAGQEIKITVWLIGYKKKEVEAKIGEDLIIELELEPLAFHEIVVSADSVVSDEKSQKTVTLNRMDIYRIPGTAADPLYASHVLPGVNNIPDASSTLIRGGAPDEVAYFFDGIEIKHPFLSRSLHESYFSIFDNQVIENFSVSTSGFSSKFGDALSGVMDLTAKDSLANGEGGLGISILGLNSYIGLPIKKLGTFVGSYNRSHSYLMTKINRREESEFGIENAFAKIIFPLNKFHSLRVISLFDDYDFSHVSGFSTSSKNRILGLSLTSVLAKNFVIKSSFSQTHFRTFYQFQDKFRQEIEDNIFQGRFDTSLDLESHYIEFGADFEQRKIDVFLKSGDSDDYKTQGTRLGFYINDKFRILNNFYVHWGGRIYSLNFDNYKFYFDPRASVAYLLTRNDILRFSLGIYHQFGDYFLLKENKSLKPKNSYHFSLSYDKTSEKTNIRITVYDKEYQSLFLIKEKNIISNEGYGYARGAEFFIKKKERRFDFLFVYNFLHSRRKENEVQKLVRSPYEIDHSFTAIFALKFKNASLGVRYSYASGMPFTPLLDRKWDDESQAYLPLWGEPYSQRYPFYRRMDINGTKTFQFLKRMIVVYFGITNVFNNKNILRYEYSDDYSLRKNNYSIFGRTVFIGLYIPFF